MPLVIKQLQQLWSLSMLNIVFEPLLSFNAQSNETSNIEKEKKSLQSQKKGLISV